MEFVLSVCWVFAPTAFANMSASISKYVPLLNKIQPPLDLGRVYRGKRVFGENKTFRGLTTGTLAAILGISLQGLLLQQFSWLERYTLGVNYSFPSIIVLGLLLGVGTIAGDALESFFKRQLNIQPGDPWAPFDQLDFMIGAIVLSYPILQFPLITYLTALALALLLHPTINIIGWVLHLQKRPY